MFGRNLNRKEKRSLQFARYAPPSANSVRELILADEASIRLRSFGGGAKAREPEQILEESLLWFSSVMDQDDRFEGHPRVQWSQAAPTYEQILGYCRRNHRPAIGANREANRIWKNLSNPETAKAVREQITDRIAKLFGDSSIASFLSRPFNPRNWWDYADRDRGWGVVFDLTLPWRFEGHAGEWGRWPPFDVQYVSAVSRPSIELDYSIWSDREGFEAIQAALLTKSKEREEQKERRFVRVGVKAGLVSFPSGSLRAVLLGADIATENRERMLKLARSRPVRLPVFQMRQSVEHFALDLDLVQ